MSLRELANKFKERESQPAQKKRILTRKQSNRIRQRGKRAERQLVTKLRLLGYQAVRIPVSSPSLEPLPDVFATKGKHIYAFEIKAPKDDKAYFKKKQLIKLFKFLQMFKEYKYRNAVLVGRFPYKWVFYQILEADDYVVRKEQNNNIILT